MSTAMDAVRSSLFRTIESAEAALIYRRLQIHMEQRQEQRLGQDMEQRQGQHREQRQGQHMEQRQGQLWEQHQVLLQEGSNSLTSLIIRQQHTRTERRKSWE